MKKEVTCPAVIAVSLLAFLVFSGSSAMAGGKMKGEWQITTSMQVPGMPMAIPGGSFTHCMDNSGVPYQESPDQKCETVSRDVSGNTVSWHMRCTGPDGNVEMKGSSTYNGDSMNGSMTMTTGQGNMTMQMQGQRLGPCR